MARRSMDACSNSDFASALAEYAMRWPDETATAELFMQLLGDDEDPFRRERIAGHFTASCWLVDAGGQRALLTHHKKLGLWLQLGGHADGERDLRIAALKEAEEESGLSGLRIEDGIFDLDRHWIPEHKGVPAHWHYDVRYVVRAGASEAYIVSDESHDLAWRPMAELAVEAGTDPSVQRMSRKWLARADKPL
ncbi:MAG: NUDIX domain-containing protein [Lysobacteraceae bacterium]|nr:MAG: NUDIX domain-containing protein [Xanthomonadaceae bacterium]